MFFLLIQWKMLTGVIRMEMAGKSLYFFEWNARKNEKKGKYV